MDDDLEEEMFIVAGRGIDACVGVLRKLRILRKFLVERSSFRRRRPWHLDDVHSVRGDEEPGPGDRDLAHTPADLVLRTGGLFLICEN